MFFRLFSILQKKAFFALLFLLNTPLLNADWFALNMTRGITDISNEVFELHMLIFWICVAIGVLVFSVMFYSMWAHTKKKNPCLLYTSPSPRDSMTSRMPSSA